MEEPADEQEPRRRKVMSQLWELRALQAAIDQGLRLKEEERRVCLAWIRNGENLQDVLGMLGSARMPVTFQFLRWRDGRRAVWIDGSHGERNIWWSLWTPEDGVLNVGFPYPEDRSQRGGRCERIGDELVATSGPREVRTRLPSETPAHSISVGPKELSVT